MVWLLSLKLKLIHDFLALVICLIIGVVLTYIYPLILSIGIFIMCYGLWLMATSYVMNIAQEHALSPRISRASLGAILVLTSTLLITTSMKFETRIVIILFLIVMALLAINMYYLSKK